METCGFWNGIWVSHLWIEQKGLSGWTCKKSVRGPLRRILSQKKVFGDENEMVHCSCYVVVSKSGQISPSPLFFLYPNYFFEGEPIFLWKQNYREKASFCVCVRKIWIFFPKKMCREMQSFCSSPEYRTRKYIRCLGSNHLEERPRCTIHHSSLIYVP